MPERNRIRRADIEKLRRAARLVDAVAQRTPYGFTLDVGRRDFPAVSTDLGRVSAALDVCAERLGYIVAQD